tara:strand:- start:29 stop:379 length:351 start_codon:yes stop_codon:yes gene_type:complete
MNKEALVLYLDDWDISSRIAKISSDLSIHLLFYEEGFCFDQSGANYTFIIDVKILSENDFRKLKTLSSMDNVFIIGYIEKIDAAKVKSLNKSGFSIVLKRNELLKNLKKIIYKAIN